MSGTISAVIRLLRWDKPAGRLILLIPALWGAFLAGRGTPPLALAIAMVLGTLTTSAAGCVANDLWDRNLDPLVERTRQRPLASRELSVKVAIAVGLVSLVCAGILALFLNRLTFVLCVLAVPVIGLYPAAKRVFPVPQLVLSIAWGFAVLISWTAVAGSEAQYPIWELTTAFLWGATVLWTLGFDTIYALSDRDDDERVGINSSARYFGRRTPTAIALFFLGTAVLLLCVGLTFSLGIAFYVSLAIASALWAWQSWKLHDLSVPAKTYGQTFFRLNVVQGFILLAGMILGL